ncbi:MAG: sulfatase [Planctomycetota bacterium]
MIRLALTLILAALSSSPTAGSARRAPQDSRPPLNVLWLSVEDMSCWIGPYGDTTVPTPHLDAFARQAVRYDNAFADSPVCAPARTALITGVYPTRMGAMHMRTRSHSKSLKGEPATPLYEAVPAPHVRCFPTRLRQAGYRTTNRSKTDYQFKAPAWTWSESSRKADYRDRPEETPFFAVINHAGTHESRAFPEAKRMPEAVSVKDAPIPPIYPDTPGVRDALARTYNNIAEMDRWFGAELTKLEEAGLADSTVVFFFSDHGVGLPRGKRSLYGTGTRVPLLIRFPEGRAPEGLAPGTSTDRIVSFIDFGPTVLSLAGIEPDLRLDGRAFLGDHAAAPRSAAFFHADRFDGVYDRARAVTDGTRLVIRNLMPEVPHLIANAYRERIPMTHDLYALRDGADAAWSRTPAQWQTGSSRRPAKEWYNRTGDPWEVRNLAASEALDARETARFNALEEQLDRWIDDTGDLGLIEPEAQMVRTRLWSADGTQPVTQRPELEETESGRWRIRCETEGASFGYRRGQKGPWTPVDSDGTVVASESTDGAPIEIRAHRIGYQPSEIVQVPAR